MDKKDGNRLCVCGSHLFVSCHNFRYTNLRGPLQILRKKYAKKVLKIQLFA